MIPRTSLIALFVIAMASSAAAAQQPRRLEISGLPALNFDADEGFGYGAIVEMYRYGAPGLPYRYTLQPTVFLTTQGRRDFTVFFDAPGLIDQWRSEEHTSEL